MAPAMLSSGLDLIRAHIRGMMDAVPTLPAQFERAWIILGLEFEDEGLIGIVALIIGLVAVGIGLVGIVYGFTRGYRDWMKAMPKRTPQGRAKNLGARLVYGSIMTAVFVLGTAGVFLAFNWPPLLREIVLGYLSVAIVTWVAMVVVRVLLVPPSLGVPQAERDPRLPDERCARPALVSLVRHQRVLADVRLVTFALMGTFGFDKTGRFALSIPTSFVQLAAHPRCRLAAAGKEAPAAEHGQQSERRHEGWLVMGCSRSISPWSGSSRSPARGRIYWFADRGGCAALGDRSWRARGVHYVLRAPDADSGGKPIAPVLVAVIERGIRHGSDRWRRCFPGQCLGPRNVEHGVRRHAVQPDPARPAQCLCHRARRRFRLEHRQGHHRPAPRQPAGARRSSRTAPPIPGRRG